MKEIKCPECGTIFQVDESDYQEIVSQVRNQLFNEEIEVRTEEIRKKFEADQAKELLKVEKDYEGKIAGKDAKIGDLTTQIAVLNGTINSFEAKKQAELLEATTSKTEEFNQIISSKDKEISDLRNSLDIKDKEHELEVSRIKETGKEELQLVKNEIVKLQSSIENEKLIAERNEISMREAHKQQLADRDNEIARLRDFRNQKSTKMVGEDLEQHCYNHFCIAKSQGQFKDAEFEKDNKVVEGTKGDFIFRDYVDGQECISVMFEMKNEREDSENRHKNEDFLDKLHKDRVKKGCEYAVLVTTLEKDNPLYEDGIVDFSFKYPKMLVVRPQFFMPVLRLLTEAARQGYSQKATLLEELEELRSEHRDFTKFDEKLEKFKKSFSDNVKGAHKKFKDAQDDIDKVILTLKKQISLLEGVKANFEESDQKLGKAETIAYEDLTIKKLTYGIPAVRQLIERACEEGC